MGKKILLSTVLALMMALVCEASAGGEALNQPRKGFVSIFNGKDLKGWKGLVGDPVKQAKMTPEQLTKAQAQADETMRKHWKVLDGILTFDGEGYGSICTVKEYADFEMLVDWKIESGGDSGIYLRGSPQVQIWDPGNSRVGSGGLYNNKKGPDKPLKLADNPIGQWNTFRIIMVAERVTVYLNDVLVVGNVVLENYFEPDKPVYPAGQIELQAHNSKLYFKNIFIREIPPAKPLFNGKDLTGWIAKPGTWVAQADGVLFARGGEQHNIDIWTEEKYGDFILDLDFKLAENTNSGVFLRTGSIKGWEWIQSGIEVQIHSTTDGTPHGSCGSIYDCLSPTKNMVKKSGQWNHYTIACLDSKIYVILNGEQIIDMDLNLWTEPHKNPDGTPNKFNTAYKDMPRVGHIGLQYHGDPVWFRNIRIKTLD